MKNPPEPTITKGIALNLSFLAKLILALTFLSANAYALPINSVGQKANHQQDVQAEGAYNFIGIVALNNCSGSIMRFENSLDTDLALVLTNGHCLETGMPKPGQVITNQNSRRTFGVLDASANRIGTVNATKVLYASMTNTDITVYQLAETFAEIKAKFNVDALTLSSTHPLVGTPIEIISGYWRRGYSCSIDGFASEVHEATWIWRDSIRYSRPGCEIIGGTSGSPVVAAGTRTIIGVNNTINESGEKCTMNNPCEVSENGSTAAQKGVGYAQETFWISTCVNANREFDLQQAGCLLVH